MLKKVCPRTLRKKHKNIFCFCPVLVFLIFWKFIFLQYFFGELKDQKKKEEVEEKGGGSQCSPKMTSTVMSQYPTYNQQIFSDEELSEIFQIDFAEIFGSPDKPSNKYAPKKTTVPPTKGTIREIISKSDLSEPGSVLCGLQTKKWILINQTVLCKPLTNSVIQQAILDLASSLFSGERALINDVIQISPTPSTFITTCCDITKMLTPPWVEWRHLWTPLLINYPCMNRILVLI